MFNKIIALILLLSPMLSSAAVIDYLKPALNKEGDHTIRNVDFIYMINLDKRPEKFEHSAGQLRAFGIEPYRFSAVNGWELSFDTLNNLGVKYQNGMKQGMWGTCYFKENKGAL